LKLRATFEARHSAPFAKSVLIYLQRYECRDTLTHKARALLFNLSSQSGPIPLFAKQRAGADKRRRVTKRAIARNCADTSIIQPNIPASTAR